MSVISSPVSGTILRLDVKIGDDVTPGQALGVIESMKMEIPVEAEAAGKITAIHVSPGDTIEEDAPFAEIA